MVVIYRRRKGMVTGNLNEEDLGDPGSFPVLDMGGSCMGFESKGY